MSDLAVTAAEERAWLREEAERRRRQLLGDWQGHDAAAMLRALYELRNVDEYGADRGDGTYGVSERKLRLWADACRHSFYHWHQVRGGYWSGWESDGHLNARLRDEAMTAQRAARAWASEMCQAEKPRRAAWLRDIAGDPFGPRIALGLAAVPADAVAMARAADQWPGEPAERDSARLAVLADCLEEAGAARAVVEHLRSPGPHIRGCWALDMVLGRD